MNSNSIFDEYMGELIKTQQKPIQLINTEIINLFTDEEIFKLGFDNKHDLIDYFDVKTSPPNIDDAFIEDAETEGQVGDVVFKKIIEDRTKLIDFEDKVMNSFHKAILSKDIIIEYDIARKNAITNLDIDILNNDMYDIFVEVYKYNITKLFNTWFEYKFTKYIDKVYKQTEELQNKDLIKRLIDRANFAVITDAKFDEYMNALNEKRQNIQLVNTDIINLFTDDDIHKIGFNDEHALIDYFEVKTPSRNVYDDDDVPLVPAPEPAPAPVMPLQITYGGITPLASKMLKFEFDKYIEFIKKWEKATERSKETIKSDYVKVVCDVYNEWFKFKYASKADQIQQSTTKNKSLSVSTMKQLINMGGKSVAHNFASDIINKIYPERLFPKKAFPDTSYIGKSAFNSIKLAKAFFGFK